jgi:AraC family transcriptional regulator
MRIFTEARLLNIDFSHPAMENRIETLEPTLICGKSLKMSFQNDRTFELWQSFMPLLKGITDRKDSYLISLLAFENPIDPKQFDPSAEFTKWAAVPLVKDHSGSFEKLDLYTISGGLYAVFKHRGPASEFSKSMQYIYGEWLPDSDYELDGREHFEILPQGYRPDDPNAEEDIWIPIRKKSHL